MDWSWLGSAFNILFTAVIGGVIAIAGKVIYDRRFSRRPDLRFKFGAPARFETGDIERVFQNLEVTNAGTETTTDVRINFSLPNFDLSEYQVLYDGPHNFEKTAKQVALLIPSLPPGDSVTLSFLFSPSKSNIGKIQDLFLSAKSKECVAKPLERTKSMGGDWVTSIINLGLVGGIAGFVLYIFLSQTRSVQQINEPLISSEKLGVVEKTPSEIARLTVQIANPVAPGREAEVDCYIDNMSNNPFAGYLRISAPPWAELLNIRSLESINVGARTRTLVKWKLKVPKNVYPGKYYLTVGVSGSAFDQPLSLSETKIVEVGS